MEEDAALESGDTGGKGKCWVRGVQSALWGHVFSHILMFICPSMCIYC